MPAYQALLHLLHQGPPEDLEVEAVLAAVQATLEECPEEDEMYGYLVALEEGLLEGRVPPRRLQKFLDKFNVVEAPAGQLEGELLQLAEELPESEWRTPGLVQLEAQLSLVDGGSDLEPLLAYLEQRHQEVLEQLEAYRSTSLSPEEVTEETQVGHRLLLDGLESWLQGLELLQQAAQHDEPWSEGLEVLTRGNRQLVAVQRLHQRVKAGVRRNR